MHPLEVELIFSGAVITSITVRAYSATIILVPARGPKRSASQPFFNRHVCDATPCVKVSQTHLMLYWHVTV